MLLNWISKSGALLGLGWWLLLLTPFVLLRTPTDIFPSINIPVVSVVWLYNGLSAQEIEQRLIFNHDRMISTLVNDIEHIESTAYTGAVMDMAGMVDLDKEKERMTQELAALDKEIARLTGLLDSPFAAKAPTAVVQKERDKLAQLQASQAELNERLASLT